MNFFMMKYRIFTLWRICERKYMTKKITIGIIHVHQLTNNADEYEHKVKLDNLYFKIIPISADTNIGNR